MAFPYSVAISFPSTSRFLDQVGPLYIHWNATPVSDWVEWFEGLARHEGYLQAHAQREEVGLSMVGGWGAV